MSKILSQEEVDALLQGIKEGEIETKPEPEEEEEELEEKRRDVNRYDFTHHEKSASGKFPLFEMTMERFCRSFRSTLANSLRSLADINISTIKVGNFGEFLTSLPLPSSIHLFKMPPLKGISMMVAETGLVFALVDIFFGGSGKSSTKVESREFTIIETRIIKRVVQMMLRDFKRAWQSVHPIDTEYVRSETNPQFAKIIHPNDKVLVLTCITELEEHSGKIYFCFPQSVLEPIWEKIRTGLEGQEETEEDRIWRERFKEEVGDLEIDVNVELGRAESTGRELIKLKVGDIIQLERLISEDIKINVGGLPKMEGQPGLYNGKIAVQISSFIEEGGGEK